MSTTNFNVTRRSCSKCLDKPCRRVLLFPSMSLDDFYPFEPREATELSLIPLRVRYRLDCAGVRLRLGQWQAMTPEEKVALLQLPVATPEDLDAYRAALRRMADRQGVTLLADTSGTGNEEWRHGEAWPAVVISQCEAQGLPLPPVSHWQALAEPDRHAMFVLARSNHSQTEFLAAISLFCAR
jgi:hypothetical protein